MSKLTMPVSDRDHFQGPESAAVTLLEYGDYECPHCAAAYPVVKEIQRRVADLRFVYRNFPLSEMHPHAEGAAEAAEAAASQSRFWEMHDKLFEHYRALDDGHLIGYAAQIGLDLHQFERELRERTHEDRVREDFMSGVRSGVNGTPTFFINGVRHNGSADLDSLLEAIQQMV
jgi:protein-disulfide isomerase